MHRKAIATAAVVALVLLLLLVGALVRSRRSAEPEVAPAGPGYPVGVSVGDTLRDLPDDQLRRALDAVVDSGAGWVRVDVQWTHVQPDSRGDFSWGQTDRVVRAARARGLSVLALLTYTPAWARSPGCGSFTCPPADPADFAAFAGAAATRYRGAVAAWEVWNEPNAAKFWARPDAGAYAALLRATSEALRRAQPGARVVLGGLSALADGSRAVAAPRYLADVCRAGGCARLTAVGFHPYTYPRLATDTAAPSTAWTAMSRPSALGPALLQVLSRAGYPALPLWVTEYGAPGADPAAGSGCSCVDEQQQARIVASGVAAASQDPDRVGAIFVYGLVDTGTGADVEDHFGLLRTDGSPKPAYDALRRAASAIGRTGRTP